MYSVKYDVVLDPFLGTGTTMAAAMASGRNCVGFEIDSIEKKSFPWYIKKRKLDGVVKSLIYCVVAVFQELDIL